MNYIFRWIENEVVNPRKTSGTKPNRVTDRIPMIIGDNPLSEDRTGFLGKSTGEIRTNPFKLNSESVSAV